MPNYRNNTFNNPNDIDNFFKKFGFIGFVDWFNKKIAGRESWGSKRIESSENWYKVWSNSNILLNKDTFNLIEFLCLNSIIINETGGRFLPLSEGLGTSGHPGISYAFDKISGLKRSYNDPTDGVSNKTAYDLFNDSIFKNAHVTKPFGDVLKNTDNVVWKGSTFPTGFSGNIDAEVDRTGKSNTFIYEADFVKFRGRGFIQTTSRISYKELVKYVIDYNGSNSTINSIKSSWLLNSRDIDTICTISTNKQWDTLFNETDFILPSYAVWLHSLNNNKYSWIESNQSDSSLKNDIFNMGLKISGGHKYSNIFYARVMQQLSLIESIDIGDVVQSEGGEYNYSDDNDFNQEESRYQRTGEDPTQSIIDESKNKQGKIDTLINVIPSKIKPNPIKMNLPPQKDVQDEILQSLGNFPFVWYNSYQIEVNDIQFFQLYISNNIPTLKLSFKDTLNLMRDKAFPLDDSKIQIFLNPRSDQLHPIFLQFKIVKFSFDGPNLLIDGVIDVNQLYTKRFKSYSNMSSYKLFMEFCKEVGMGFNTNIDNTNDIMTWINTGQRNLDFLNSVIDSSYLSDQTFLLYYIDYYYNINYIDIEKELNRNIKEELGVANTGIEEIAKIDDKEKVSRLWITNDYSMQNSNSYFSKYRVINNSTKISIQEGYLSKVKFYDELSKDFLIFDIDSITSRGDKSIILKGAPQDDSFFTENTQIIYAGKLDTDNMHSNYQYSSIQNNRNISELQKVCIEVEMGTPNYNLYKFQKLYVLISNQASTPSASQINNRLSGEWFIIDIKFMFDGRKYSQILRLIKKELDLSPEEIQQESDQIPEKELEPSTGSTIDNVDDDIPSIDATEQESFSFIVDPIPTVDNQSEQFIVSLIPEVQSMVRQLIRKSMASGIDVRVTKGYISYDEQTKLYDSGESTLKSGYSVYNFGISFDIGIYDNNILQETSPLYDQVGKIGISVGLYWGGNIQPKSHRLFELKPLWARHLDQLQYIDGLRSRKLDNKSLLI